MAVVDLGAFLVLWFYAREQQEQILSHELEHSVMSHGHKKSPALSVVKDVVTPELPELCTGQVGCCDLGAG